MKTHLRVLCATIAVTAHISAMATVWNATANGAKATVAGLDIEVQFYSPTTVRIIKTPVGANAPSTSLSITAKPDSNVTVTVGKHTVSSPELGVRIAEADGTLTFVDGRGHTLLSEKGVPAITVADYPEANGWFNVTQAWKITDKEQLYGLGSLSEPGLSRRGLTKRLLPGNIADGFPVVQSSKGYGIVWDNYSPTTFVEADGTMSFASEIAEAVDYYMINGNGSIDAVVAQMRLLSGDVPMAPLWTYGYWQSRERYKTQYEPTAVVSEYRSQGIPLDGIIQDWQYWGNNYQWNAMEFLNENFPRPQAMLDSIHGMDAHMIISVWSSFGPMTHPYAELRDSSLLFDIATWPESGLGVWPPRKDYPSGVKVYNPYKKEARDIYWKYLAGLHKMGLDGWWMDSTEPDHFDDKMDFATGIGSFRKVRGAYPLMTVGGVYDHQREVDSTRRVFILTRSGWFGQQRYGANVWTGDVVSTWDMLRRQVPQHLNFTLSGNPNTNSDLGGFFCGRYNMPDGRMAYANPLYGELTVRWTQLGLFTPMMRAHGSDSPCEIYLFKEAGVPIYEALVDAVKMRYALLPYIYSTAWEVTANRGSFMRPLVMDFPNDSESLTANDRFMFGRSLLAAPILAAHYTQESAVHPDIDAGTDIDLATPYTVEVRLPKGTDWYDFNTGKHYHGGETATLQATLSTIPLFARAGSIVPIGPDVQYAHEKPWNNLTIRVFPGADGSFVLYEDEGDNYNYEKGLYTTIPMSYDHRSHRFSIGERTGSYPGMIDNRKFTIVNMANGATEAIDYSGKAIEITL